MKLEEAFQGDKYNRGRLWSIEPNGKKNGSLEKLPLVNKSAICRFV